MLPNLQRLVHSITFFNCLFILIIKQINKLFIYLLSHYSMVDKHILLCSGYLPLPLNSFIICLSFLLPYCNHSFLWQKQTPLSSSFQLPSSPSSFLLKPQPKLICTPDTPPFPSLCLTLLQHPHHWPICVVIMVVLDFCTKIRAPLIFQRICISAIDFDLIFLRVRVSHGLLLLEFGYLS